MVASAKSRASTSPPRAARPASVGSGGAAAAVAAEEAAAAAGVKTFTWQEIAEHNHAGSAWIYCGRKVYDVTEWVDRHPGGRDMILLGAGRDWCGQFLN